MPSSLKMGLSPVRSCTMSSSVTWLATEYMDLWKHTTFQLASGFFFSVSSRKALWSAMDRLEVFSTINCTPP